MAVLSASELQSVRNACAKTLTVTYTKPIINAAAQAFETWLSDNQASASAAMDAAIAPATLTNAQKKKIAAEVFRLKYDRDK